MSSKRRVYKVAERIQWAVAKKLLETSDPRFTLVTVTSVVVTPDLRLARVYWSTLGDESRKDEVAEAFTRAQGLFKRAVAEELNLRFVPELKFFFDDTVETQQEVATLLQRMKEHDQQVLLDSAENNAGEAEQE